MLEYLVLPLVADHVPVTGRHAVLGASMGGLQALHTVLRWPERFETALTQGAAVRHYMPSEIRPLPEMLLRAQPPDDVRVWQQVGAMDFLYESNIEFAPSLAGAGEHELVVTNDAHTYEAWRHWLPDGLRFAFGR